MPIEPHPKKNINTDTASKRRRDSSKHRAILVATRELVDENGIRGLSLKSIASRANVSRNVLYNWWGGEIRKIVEEALLPKVSEWPLPDNGNFKDDIEELLERSIDAVHKPHILKGFLFLAAEVARDRDKLDETSRHFRAPYAKLVQKIISNAEKRGEIKATLDTKIIAQVMSGSVLQFAISQSLGKRQAKRALSELLCKLVSK